MTVDALRNAIRNRWEDRETTASEMVAEPRLTMLASAEEKNAEKGLALIFSMVLEIIAVALVGVAMAFVLLD